LKSVSAANLKGFRDEIDQYSEIRRTVAELTAILANMNTLSPEMHSDGDFALLIDAVSAKLAA
jgi:internalin A